MQKPRIAIVVPGFRNGGGVPMVASLLVQGLKRDGTFDAEIVSLATSRADQQSVRLLAPLTWRGGPSVATETSATGPIRHVGAWFAEVETQRYRPRRILTSILNSYDIVQMVAGTPAWAEVAGCCSKPVCLQVATLIDVERRAKREASHGPGLWQRAMTASNRRIERRVWTGLDAVFVENAWMFEHVRTKLPASKVHFAPPGVDTEHFAPRSYDHSGYVLSVGRFSDPRKNVRLLFEAYAIVKRRVPSASGLVLAGARPREEDMEYASALGLDDDVVVHEDVSADRLANLYRGAGVFALSSNEEGLGLVILEAMASGVPVVATDCGGPSTAVQHGRTGLLTPVGDAPALAAGIEALLVDRERAIGFSERSRQRAVEEFSLDVAIARFVAVYDGLRVGSIGNRPMSTGYAR